MREMEMMQVRVRVLLQFGEEKEEEKSQGRSLGTNYELCSCPSTIKLSAAASSSSELIITSRNPSLFGNGRNLQSLHHPFRNPCFCRRNPPPQQPRNEDVCVRQQFFREAATAYRGRTLDFEEPEFDEGIESYSAFTPVIAEETAPLGFREPQIPHLSDGNMQSVLGGVRFRTRNDNIITTHKQYRVVNVRILWRQSASFLQKTEHRLRRALGMMG
ncbi:hypothetical protein KSP40_PGU014602 [Platanthera guangdongensis]|uniref:Uncharacterized protein n=1 Tax=Platanthera guangdongensis TaxID=2320717 RepID=A0ABR2MEI7_9ASPA